jgi:hypothetical protein
MTKEEKISIIYEEMADKTLDFGCLIQTQDWAYETINEVTIYTQWYYIEEYSLWDEQTRRLDIRSIIWHPVLIGNVLQFMKDLDWDCIPNRIYILWEKLTLPIDEQSDECIDFVYALTKE